MFSVQLGSYHFHKPERSQGHPLVEVPRTVAVKDEDHEPSDFCVVSLPATRVVGSLDLDPSVSMLGCIFREPSGGNQVRIPIMITISDQTRAVSWDDVSNELAH